MKLIYKKIILSITCPIWIVPFILCYGIPCIIWEEISEYVDTQEWHKQHNKVIAEREKQEKKERKTP